MKRGVVAAGHPETARAAEFILREGGNAFDAAVAAHFAACVAEPVLASLGGGGFLLAQRADGEALVYDFFAHTPRRKRPAAGLDFYPIHADFGAARQEFHIGLGAAAVPGAVRGMYAVHADLCSLPMPVLLAPAIELAREGVRLNALQGYIFGIVAPVLTASAEARASFAGRAGLVGAGERLALPQLADTLEALARGGEGLFYEGAIGRRIAQLCAERGGHLRLDDLAEYAVIKREPLALDYRGAQLLINPPPSSGGILIAFALQLLAAGRFDAEGFGSAVHLERLAQVMALTNKARLDEALCGVPDGRALLDARFVEAYRRELLGRPASSRGTTHISVVDGEGNCASLTVSNGEGCGHLVPGTGVMLNNMLGEEDLNPGGFHRWAPGVRLTSMMAPALLIHPEGWRIALGSGGSNRIRTAILQVLVNLLDFGLPLEQAVNAPRIHLERERLDIEGGFEAAQLAPLLAGYPRHKQWGERNLFFGGVHAAGLAGAGFIGAGDPRRGGVVRLVG